MKLRDAAVKDRQNATCCAYKKTRQMTMQDQDQVAHHGEAEFIALLKQVPEGERHEVLSDLRRIATAKATKTVEK